MTTGAKGGLDVGSERWHWDVVYSYSSYGTRETSMNLKEEGIRNWILAGASTVVADPNQQDTYFVDADFYDNRLVGNIVRPVQGSEIDGLVGENVMRAKSSSNFLTLTVNGTLGDLGIFHKPVKFALRSEIANQTMEIIPDERSLNTDGEGWYNIGAIAAKGDRDRKALALELAVPVVSRLDLSLAARVDHYSDDSDISSRMSGQIKFLYRLNDWLKFRGGYSQTFRAPDMFNIYGQSDAFSTVADFSAPGCFDGEVYVCGFTTVATTRAAGHRADRGIRRRLRLRLHLAAGHELHAHRRLVPDRAQRPRGHGNRLRHAAPRVAVRQRRARWLLAAVRGRPQPHHPQRLRRGRAHHRPADQPGQHGARGRGPARRVQLRVRAASARSPRACATRRC